MLYKEYEEYKTKYYEAQKTYNEILTDKETLFAKTQPQATNYQKELVVGGTPSNAFDNYVIEKEKKKIDERLEEARSILEDREKLLKLKEHELKESKDWNDIIYILYYIEKLSVYKIERRVPYQKSQIYERLNVIKQNIGQNRKKLC